MSGTRSLRIHAVLLAVAAAWAFQSWNRDEVSLEDQRLALAWSRDTTEVVSVQYRAPDMEVQLQHRSDARGRYFWGLQIENQGVDTLEFPVGATGHRLVSQLAELRVIRDLGTLSPEQITRFGLSAPDEEIAVNFQDEQRLLALGDTTYASGNRYATEAATGVGYVLPTSITRPLAIGEGSLRERWLHHFSVDDVGQVRLIAGDADSAAGGQSRTIIRTSDGEWSDQANGDTDVAFGNFMQRVDQLAIAGYGNTPMDQNLRLLFRLEYSDEEGESLGFVELLLDEAAASDPYYLRSERTRILAEAVTALAERAEEGLADVQH